MNRPVKTAFLQGRRHRCRYCKHLVVPGDRVHYVSMGEPVRDGAALLPEGMLVIHDRCLEKANRTFTQSCAACGVRFRFGDHMIWFSDEKPVTAAAIGPGPVDQEVFHARCAPAAIEPSSA